MTQGRTRDKLRLVGKPLWGYEMTELKIPCEDLEGKGKQVATPVTRVN